MNGTATFQIDDQALGMYRDPNPLDILFNWNPEALLGASHLPRERNVAMTDPVSKLQVWLIDFVSDVIV